MLKHRLSEIELLERAHEDLEAFGELIERYRSVVTRQCFSRVNDRDHAEDLAQEAFVRAYLKLDQLKDPTRFSAWLRRIASNICNEFIRSPQRREWAFDEVPDDPSPDDILPAQLDALLAALPEQTRLCFELFYKEGLSISETAEAVNMTVPSVRARLQRAKAVLRKEMAEMAPVEKSPFTERVLDKLKQLKSLDARERADAAEKLHFALVEDKTQRIVSLLKDPDPLKRTAAIKASRKYRSPRVRNALVDILLRDEWEENRMKAAGALVAQRDPTVIPDLMLAVEDPQNPQEVVAAAKSSIKQLEKLEPSVDQEMEELRLRKDVARASKDKKARVEILRRLKTALLDPDPNVRIHSIKAIQEIGDKRAVGAIARMLDDPVPGVAVVAAIALRKLKSKAAIPALLKAVRSGEGRIRWNAFSALTEISDKSVLPEALKVFEQEHVYDLIFWVLNADLMMKLASPEHLPQLKQAVEKAAERFVEDRGTPKDRLPAVKGMWYRTLLGKLGDSRNVPEMIAELREHPDDEHLIAGLARVGDVRALDVLEESLNGNASAKAAEALASFDEPGIQALRNALYHEDPNVTAAACRGIWFAGGDRKSIDRLEQLADSNLSTSVRLWAKAALGRSRKSIPVSS